MSEQTFDGSVDVAELYDAAEAAVARAREAALTAVSSIGLTALLDRGEQLNRSVQSLNRHLVAEVDRRGVAGEYAITSTKALLMERLRISEYDARDRVRQAREFTPRIGLTGEILEPLFAPTSAALDDGSITLAHAAVIAQTRSGLPARVDAEHGQAAEEFLVEQARQLNPTQLGYVATRLTATLNPDGKYTEEQDRQRKRHAGLIKYKDGSSKPTGYYTPELTAILEPIYESLGRSQATEDMPDDRTPGQRVHDGLIEVGQKVMREDVLPDSGGVPVSMLITVTAQNLDEAAAGGDPLVHDAYDTPLPLSTVLAMGGEIDLTGVRLSCTGGIESFGQTRRLATPGQRRALAARDKGCSYPHCTRTHAWAEIHHIKEWLKGGGTDLNNLVMLCRYHHRHFEAAGWQVRMAPDGMPEWIPPAWIDEQRRPRRNTLHNQPPIPSFD